MVQFIPNGLDIAQFVKQYPPVKIEGFKMDKLAHIMHLVYLIPANNKSLNCIDGFVPIYSKLLKKRVHNYRHYLDYLCEHKILESDNTYAINWKSKGYRFTEQYQIGVNTYNIKDTLLIRSIKKARREKFRSLEGYEYLTKWFNENLQIDYKVAMEFAKEEYRLKKAYPELRDFDVKHYKYKDPYTQYTSNIHNIERIKIQDFYMSVDQNVHRFHSNLTCKKSIYRNLLTYNGQKLVSVDIKNSQPYLSLILLNKNFWFSKKFEAVIYKYFKIYNNFNTTTFNLYNINRNLYNYMFETRTDINSYIMCLKEAKMPINTDVAKFESFVTKGKFYEELAAAIKEETGIEIIDRKDLKAVVFLVLFTGNRFLGQKKAEPKRIFKQLFPSMYELFKAIKKKNSTLLPRILQSVESHLMLKVIAKRISKERPELPIFTIHDSIATTVGNEEYVQRVIREELTKYIGHPPSLSVEYWTPENMVHKSVPKEVAA